MVKMKIRKILAFSFAVLMMVSIAIIPASASEIRIMQKAEEKVTLSGEEYVLIQELNPLLRASSYAICQSSGVSTWQSGNYKVAQGYTNVISSTGGYALYHYTNTRWEGARVYSESGRKWGTGTVYSPTVSVDYYTWSRDYRISPYVYWGV